jgi:hypothetical protein
LEKAEEFGYVDIVKILDYGLAFVASSENNKWFEDPNSEGDCVDFETPKV